MKAETSLDSDNPGVDRRRASKGQVRIVVDAREVFRSHRRGMGKTLINLYSSLAELQPHWHFHLVHQLAFNVPQLAPYANIHASRIDFLGLNRFNLWEQAVLPISALAARAHVLHAPANTGPRRSAVPLALNIHDLIPLQMAPNAMETRLWLSRVRRAARLASKILTGSDYSKRKLIEVLDIPHSKIAVIPWAPDKQIRKVNDPELLRNTKAKYGLAEKQPYLLSFGADDPRKNTAELIQAYATLPERLRHEFRLLIVGVQAPKLARFRDWAESLGVSEQVAIHGFALEEEIAPLLSAATMLCFVSKYEGFGLPILDAFACGTPVLAGNCTSIPEVGNDAVEYIDPYQIESIRAGMIRLIQDEKHRRKLAERGYLRSKEFTWERTAGCFAEVFLEIAQRNGKVG